MRVHRDLGRQYTATIVALQPLPPVVPPPVPAAPAMGMGAAAAAAAGRGGAFVAVSGAGPSGGGGVVVKTQPQQVQQAQQGGGNKPVLTWRSTRDGGRWRYAELTLAQVCVGAVGGVVVVGAGWVDGGGVGDGG